MLKRLYYIKTNEYPHRNITYNDLLKEFNTISIKDIQDKTLLTTLHKIIHNCLDVTSILSQITFYVPPVKTRNYLTFAYTTPKTEHYNNSPLLKMYRTYHKKQDPEDIFKNS